MCPWMEQGNVVDYLARASENERVVDCVTLALDVAMGLEHLHSVNIIHADLKGVSTALIPEIWLLFIRHGFSSTFSSRLVFVHASLISVWQLRGTPRSHTFKVLFLPRVTQRERFDGKHQSSSRASRAQDRQNLNLNCTILRQRIYTHTR